jgi:dihydropteroate synthase
VTDPVRATGSAAAGPPSAPGQTLILGVLNVTPDSFSDGGRYLDMAAAIAHGMRLTHEGADIVDVGGESTRPGAQRVSADEEAARVVPVVRALSDAGATVSIDTMRASTAAAAIASGASIVNDVSGGLADPDMARVVADSTADFVAMHWRGHSTEMDSLAVYEDVVADVCRELSARMDALVAGGVDPARIILDPGLGFAKTAEHNWRLLGGLDMLMALGPRLLIGASRKRFLSSLPTRDAVLASDPRDLPTAIVSALCADAGVWGVRVHDAAASRVALDVVAARHDSDRGVRRISPVDGHPADTLGDVTGRDAR